MTDRDLITEGRRLLAEATNGPWQVTDLRNAEDGNRDCLWVDSWGGPEVEGVPHSYATVAEMTEDEGLQVIWGLADAELIAWMRNNLGTILDEWEAARNTYEQLQRDTQEGWTAIATKQQRDAQLIADLQTQLRGVS
ncbi:hypothetical protein [Nocardia xishanensis]|uniref:hypothetical protein n=1 Tax=Nocardia xishanensis TaxID=238964 RepID=UPI0008352D7F|nr:hypothetical protein [Nocardia xishanensis]